MAVTFQTLFRVVQIYRGNVYKDRVMRDRNPVTIGEHSGCDLVVPLSGTLGEWPLFKPADGGLYQLMLPQSTGGSGLIVGAVNRADGSKITTEDIAAQGGQLVIRPGDWGLFTLPGSDNVEILCQYVRLPVPQAGNPLLRPFRYVKESGAILLSNADQYTMLSAVLLLALLFIARLNLPHGTTLESDQISRRFSTIIRSKPKRQMRMRRREVSKKKRRHVVIRDKMDLTNRPKRQTARTERRVINRRNLRDKHIRKGAVKALDSALQRSRAVQRLFRDQGGLFTQVDKALSGLDGATAAGGGGGDGVVDPYATRSSDGQGSIGATAEGGGPMLAAPVKDRGRIGNRADRRVRVARVGLGSSSVSGTGLGRAQIARVVAARRGAVKYCYESALRSNPNIGSGRVVVLFKISPAGTVASARVAGNTLKGGARVGSCITRAIRRWRFPKSKGYAQVRYPFLFSSGLK